MELGKKKKKKSLVSRVKFKFSLKVGDTADKSIIGRSIERMKNEKKKKKKKK